MSTPSAFPDAKSPNLFLTQPTEEEKNKTYSLNSAEWRGALSVEDYFLREAHLSQAPHARLGGSTHWILVERNLPPNKRPILGSCETLRKRAFLSTNGHVNEVVSHSIGSVFCNPEYRGHGYASRMMRELGRALETWQTDASIEGREKCVFTVLYSDIGKLFYAGHGWHPFPSAHVAFPPARLSRALPAASKLAAEDLGNFCHLDEHMIREHMERVRDRKTHVAIICDEETIQWHHAREEFISQKLHRQPPMVKGAVIGEEGHRVWAIWTRSYYEVPVPGKHDTENILHILRLVVEDEEPASNFSSMTGGPSYDEERLQQQTDKLKAILEIAQHEAMEAHMNHVELWNPTALVKMLIERTGLEHSRFEREKESVTSLMWYGEGHGTHEEIEWMGNEKYSWC